MEQQSVAPVHKTYQYRLNPTPEQAQALEIALLRCRSLDNCALEQRKTWWARGQGIGATYYQQKAELPDLKAACPEYAEVNAQVLHDVILRVARTDQAFFRRVRNGETPGYPRFQGQGRSHSFTYPQYGGGAVLDGRLLRLSKIGRIPIRLHRPLHGTPKTVTISKAADGWYACISCAEVPTQPLPLTGRETGIDVGLKVFLVTADGEYVENPRYHRKAEQGLKKAQRRVSRRKKGRKRWWKAVGQCAKKYLKLQRQRTDFHQKTALSLVREYDTISLEDLRVRNLSRRPQAKPNGNGNDGYVHNGAARKAGRNKSIQDAAWYTFRRLLTGKAAWGSMGRQASGSDPSGVHDAEVQRLWRADREESVCAHPCLYFLRADPGPRCERGPKHSVIGPGRPIRRERGWMHRASPEKPRPLGLGSMSPISPLYRDLDTSAISTYYFNDI